jgi:hypothetical protein
LTPRGKSHDQKGSGDNGSDLPSTHPDALAERPLTSAQLAKACETVIHNRTFARARYSLMGSEITVQHQGRERLYGLIEDKAP